MIAKEMKIVEYRCPQCQRFIYNRRRKTCMWCECELPTELLYTQAELEKLDNESALREKERQKRAIEKELENKKRNSGGIVWIPS